MGNQALGQSLLKMKCISLRSINFRENTPVFLNHFCSLQMDSNRKSEERKRHRTQEQTNKSAPGISTLSASPIFGFFYSHFLFYLTGTTGILNLWKVLTKVPSRHFLCLYSTSVHEATVDSAVFRFVWKFDRWIKIHSHTCPPHPPLLL